MAISWRSTWAVDEAAAIAESEARDTGATGEQEGDGAVRFEACIASPVELKRPQQEDEERAPVPCELTVEWAPPRRCRSLHLEVVASARHVELFVEGTRRNLLGESEHGEVYFGTFRGARCAGEPPRFTVSQAFDQRSGEHNVLGHLSQLRLKFVSLVGDKQKLQLHALRCVYLAVPDAAPAPAPPVLSGVASALAGLSMGGAPMAVDSGVNPAAGVNTGNSVQLLLASAQQSMMQQMESKIAAAIDAKLALLSQRLAFSEQQIFKLHQRIDSGDSEQKASVGRLEDRLASLEAYLAALGKTEMLVNEQQPTE